MSWQDEWKNIPEDQWPIVDEENPMWRVRKIHRLTACENQPGLKMFYIRVFDADGNPATHAKVRFETEASEGIVYDHPNLWGVTGSRRGNLGYVEWNSLGVPTWYTLFMEDEPTPLIKRLRTDLGNEYCKPGSPTDPHGWRPVNRPGIYSYIIEIEFKG